MIMKKLVSTIIAFTLIAANSAVVNAAGGVYSPYSPYVPHPPIDTGLVSDPIYFIGLVMLLAGLSLVVNARSLKSKLYRA